MNNSATSFSWGGTEIELDDCYDCVPDLDFSFQDTTLTDYTSQSWGADADFTSTPEDWESADPATSSASASIGFGPASSSSGQPPPKKRRIRSHQKTRGGCFSCKKRRVKCSEERPECRPCVRNGLRCVYPFTREATGMLSREVSTPQAQSMAETYSGNLEYTALDMRLLHVFLVKGYPHLPIECDAIWTREVPQWAHSHSFLMHAMLALGASHLVREGDAKMTPAAHFHRLKAMQGINELIAHATRTSNEDDALIAACYALAFQVACIGDSPQAFWITIRTITVVNAEIWQNHHNSTFGKSTAPEKHNEAMHDKLKDFPPLNKSLISEAQESLMSIEPLCESVLETQFWALLWKTCEGLLKSSVEGYLAFTLIYTCVAIMPSEDFNRITDPQEHVIQLLQEHFMAIQTLMGPILMQEWSHRREETPETEKSTARWADGLCSHRPFEKYLQWPRRLQARARDRSLWNEVFEPSGPLSTSTLDELDTKGHCLKNHKAHIASLVAAAGLPPTVVEEMSEAAARQ